MNRMACITVALCAALLITAGVGVVAAAQQKLPPHYRVVQFDVYHNNEVVGTLNVNTNQWTYVLNAEGLVPGTEYYFYCLGRFPQVSLETANKNGNLHMKGAWDLQTADITASPTFVLTTTPLTGTSCVPTQLTAKSYLSMYMTEVWGELKTSSGDPLPGQHLVIEEPGIYDYWGDASWSVWKETNTGADGSFDVTGGSVNDRPKVIYEGGSYNGVTYCSSWVMSTHVYYMPL